MRHRNPIKDSGNLAPDLRDLLNASAAIALDAKQVHWNVKGPSFQGLHKLFDEIHTAAVEYADLIGERLAQFGLKAVPRPGDSGLPRLEDADVSGHGQATAMAAELAAFSERVRAAAKVADEQGDPATLDILSEILRGSDKYLWFVESHLGVDGAKFNPNAEAFQAERCSGCDNRISSGAMAWLSDRFGGWFCSKACERRAGLNGFGGRRTNPYGPVEALQPMQSNPRRRNMDEELRAFERAAAAGDRDALSRLVTSRVRAGIHVSPEEIVRAIKAWWKKKARRWGDMSWETRFWTPQEWATKGESFGNEAPVNLTSEGGFNRILCYTEGADQARLVEEWNRLIESLGWRWETNTCWAFSFYPARRASNPRRRNDDSCSRCGDRLATGGICPHCGPSIEDMMRQSYRRHEGLRTRSNSDRDYLNLGDEAMGRLKEIRDARARRDAPRPDKATYRPSELCGPMNMPPVPVGMAGYQPLGVGKRRRSQSSGSEGNPRRRNAACPICGATDAYVSPFSGRLDCRVCASTTTSLGDAFNAAVAASEAGDEPAFERHATTWAHLLYGSKAAGEAAIDESAMHEGSRIDGLRVMVFG